MKKVFAALQMMQQPNRYEGGGYRAKAHRPERGKESAKKCMKQAAKEKAGPSSAGRRGSKASSSSAHQPNAQARKASSNKLLNSSHECEDFLSTMPELLGPDGTLSVSHVWQACLACLAMLFAMMFGIMT